ncbi:MAG: HEAT repeat domain-containing protein [Candidatus Helarchaeota archaeon]|nr:HEAT repeat domain-containing protein [Candidatus Helarchaeota archaeon]
MARIKKVQNRLKKLENPQQKVREKAIRELYDIFNNASEDEIKEYDVKLIVEVLTEHLNDSSDRVRETIAEILGKLGVENAITPLIVLLGDESSSVGRAAHFALREIGEIAIEPLISALKDPNAERQENAMSTLTDIGDPRIIPELISCLKDKNEKIQEKAMWALIRLKTAAADSLISVLRDRNADVRYYAARALGYNRIVKVVEPLIESINDEDSLVRYTVVFALMQIGDKRALEPLVIFFKNLNETTTNSKSSQLKEGFMKFLGGLNDPKAVAPLLTYLTDEIRDVRLEAVNALGKIGDKRAVEPLIARLNDEAAWVRWSAAESLGKVGDSRAIEPLIACLQIDNYNMRRSAAEALGEIGDKKAVTPLIKLLKDYDGHMQVSAIEALGKIQDNRAIDPLEPLLEDESPSIRKATVKALISFAKSEMKALIAILKVEKSDLIEILEATLTEIPIDRIIQALTLNLKNSGFLVRKMAANWLGKIKDPRSIGLLIESLQDDHWAVRKRATISLGKVGDSRAVEPLIKCLKDEDTSVRYNAAEALVEIGDERAIKPLTSCLNDESAVIRNKIPQLLEVLKEKVHLWPQLALDESKHVPEAEPLISALRDGDTTVIDELGNLGDPRAVDPLIKCLKSKDIKVRIKAAEALGKIKDLRAVRPLIEKLTDSKTWIRSAAVKALGNLGDKRAVEPLFKLLKKSYESKYLINELIDSLLKIEIDMLEQIIKYEKDEKLEPDKRSKIAKKLGSLKESEIIEPLYQRLNDKDHNIRFRAAKLLSEINDLKSLEPLLTYITDKYNEKEHGRFDNFLFNKYLATQALINIIMKTENIPSQILENFEEFIQKKYPAISRKYASQINKKNFIMVLKDIMNEFSQKYFENRDKSRQEAKTKGRALVSKEPNYLLKTFDRGELLFSLAISPDGDNIISGELFNINFLDFETGKVLKTLKDGHIVSSISISPDGEYLVSTSKNSEKIYLWEYSTGKLLYETEKYGWNVESAIFSPDGKTIVCGAGHEGIRDWEVPTLKPLRLIYEDTVTCWDVKFTPDGKYLVAGTTKGDVQIWDFITGKFVKRFQHEGFVLSVAVSPDGQYVISGSTDNNIKIWDLIKGKLVRTLKGHEKAITSVAISPDGRYIVSGSADETIKVWDFSSGKLFRTLKGHKSRITAVAITPDGHFIVSASEDYMIKVWDYLDVKKEQREEIHQIMMNLETYEGEDLINSLEELAFLLTQDPPNRKKYTVPEIIQPITRALTNDSPKVSITAARVFENLDSELLSQYLHTRLSSGRPKEKVELIKAMDKIDDSLAIQFLSTSIRSYNSQVKAKTIEVLHKSGNERAIELLFITLKDADLEVREKSAYALEYFMKKKSETFFELLSEFIDQNYVWNLTRLVLYRNMRWGHGMEDYDYEAYTNLLKQSVKICKGDPNLERKFRPMINKIKQLRKIRRFAVPIAESDNAVLGSHINSRISVLEAEVREKIEIRIEHRPTQHPSGWEDRNYEWFYIFVLTNPKLGPPLEKAKVKELKFKVGHTLLNEIAYEGMKKRKLKIRCSGRLIKDKWGYMIKNVSNVEEI